VSGDLGLTVIDDLPEMIGGMKRREGFYFSPFLFLSLLLFFFLLLEFAIKRVLQNAVWLILE
jgi:hypothetical protein